MWSRFAHKVRNVTIHSPPGAFSVEMSLKLQPAVAIDARALALLFFEAFHLEDPFGSLIYPHGATPKAVEHEYNAIVNNFQDPHVHFLKVVDTGISWVANSFSRVSPAACKLTEREYIKHLTTTATTS
jgi:hypothetical protein